MTRRESLQTLAVATAGSLFLAGCTEADAITFLVDGKLKLNERHLNYIETISESILPFKHLGDKVTSPTTFITTMINDGLNEEDVLKFTTGFDQFKLLVKENKVKIKEKNKDDILALVKSNIESAEIHEELEFFMNSMKSLSVRHLKNSQLYQEKVLEYKLVPERYDGCIPA